MNAEPGTRPQPSRLTDSRLANVAANAIHQAFQDYCRAFAEMTGRAQVRFEKRDWAGQRADVQQRLDLYRHHVAQIETIIRHLLADRLENKLVWAGMKAVYSGLSAREAAWDLAETFFNSVTRRIFTTVGVNPQIEFVASDFDAPPTQLPGRVFRTYTGGICTPALFLPLIEDFTWNTFFADIAADVRAVSARVTAHLAGLGLPPNVDQIDMLPAPFFRGQAAYLIGRIRAAGRTIPFVLALFHPQEGIVVDAILLEESGVSILFSFARSYFHVQVARPYEVVQFIRSLIPRKRVAEIYISLGYNKHGKTELYRDLLAQLLVSTAQFRPAPGQKGMVMIVFTLPDYDLVFKIIRDRFARPKQTSRQDVKERYALVFRHDRAGRLVDAQVFEHLQIHRDRFTADLLAELEAEAGRTVQINLEHVVIEHVYVERRVIPLDLYLQQAEPEAAQAAVVEYGRAIKDLAETNIFPGDLLLKNFGVTRHGRVVFYDYDELRLLTDCRFRRIPPARHPDDELLDQPWFHINENDIFPEEFPRFMGLPPVLRQHFQTHHGDLFDVTFWQSCQHRIHKGIYRHVIPYAEQNRLH
jgi:isocitrate dehydrogenase kinase/phosphatase